MSFYQRRKVKTLNEGLREYNKEQAQEGIQNKEYDIDGQVLKKIYEKPDIQREAIKLLNMSDQLTDDLIQKAKKKLVLEKSVDEVLTDEKEMKAKDLRENTAVGNEIIRILNTMKPIKKVIEPEIKQIEDTKVKKEDEVIVPIKDTAEGVMEKFSSIKDNTLPLNYLEHFTPEFNLSEMTKIGVDEFINKFTNPVEAKEKLDKFIKPQVEHKEFDKEEFTSKDSIKKRISETPGLEEEFKKIKDKYLDEDVIPLKDVDYIFYLISRISSDKKYTRKNNYEKNVSNIKEFLNNKL